MSRHYREFRFDDPRLVGAMIERYPLATIAVNGVERPGIAHAPLTVRPGTAAGDAVDFHLARINPVMPDLVDGRAVTIVIHGPGATVSPTWYTQRFPEGADRSRVAPTYDYVTCTISGRLDVLDDTGLLAQLADLVATHEPPNGWRFDEMDPETLMRWCTTIIGFRVVIDTVDVVAKLSQNQTPADREGVVAGLRARGRAEDRALADLVPAGDLDVDSLIELIRASGVPAVGAHA